MNSTRNPTENHHSQCANENFLVHTTNHQQIQHKITMSHSQLPWRPYSGLIYPIWDTNEPNLALMTWKRTSLLWNSFDFLINAQMRCKIIKSTKYTTSVKINTKRINETQLYQWKNIQHYISNDRIHVGDLIIHQPKHNTPIWFKTMLHKGTHTPHSSPAMAASQLGTCEFLVNKIWLKWYASLAYPSTTI